MNWKESFRNLAIDIAKKYIEDPAATLEDLKYPSVHGSLCETYRALVRENEILPIQKIAESEKQRIWNKAKQYSDREDICTNISISIYVLEILTK